MATANTLATSAQTLMDDLNNNTITFESYRNSMNTIIAQVGETDFSNEDDSEAEHTVSIATRISQGEAPPVPRRR